jgi:hypothetical protein
MTSSSLNSTFQALREGLAGLAGDITGTLVAAEPALVVNSSELDDLSFVLSGKYPPNPKLFKPTQISLYNLVGELHRCCLIPSLHKPVRVPRIILRKTTPNSELGGETAVLNACDDISVCRRS